MIITGVGRERVRLVHGHQNNRGLSMTGQRCLSAWSAFNSSSTDGLCHGHHTGAALGLSQNALNFGNNSHRACMTALSMNAVHRTQNENSPDFSPKTHLIGYKAIND